MLGSKVVTWDQRELVRNQFMNASNSIKIHIGSEHRGDKDPVGAEEGDPSHLHVEVPRGMGRSVQQVNFIDIELPNTAYNVSSANNRVLFNEYDAVTTLDMQEPFALNGYYPLYATQAAAEAVVGASGYHTHDDSDHLVTGAPDLYMPSGVTNYHGTYTGSGVTYTGAQAFSCSRFYADVPPGTYTATQLAAAVERAMNTGWVKIDGSSGAAAAPQNTYKVELDLPTGRLLISAGTYTGDFGTSALATTAGPTTSFSVRGLSQPDANPVVVAAQVNPLGADISGGTKEASGLQNVVQDSPMRVVVHLKSAAHALIPGDAVELSDLVQANNASGRVVYVDRREVHVLTTTALDGSWTPAKLVRVGDTTESGSASLGPVLGLDPRRGQRQGLLSTMKTTITVSGTTYTVDQLQVYANAAQGSQGRLVSHGLEGDLPALSPSGTSTTLTLYAPHMLADGSRVGLSETDPALEVASVEAVSEGDRVPSVVLTGTGQLVPAGSTVFETSSTTHVHGSPNVRGISKVDLTRLGRCVFVALETPAQGRLGSIFVPGSNESRPFFARLQLDSDRDALEMNHDSAVGGHTFGQPVDITEMTLRVYDETGTRALDTQGVFSSVLLELVNLCN
jgi:hypothetical protein